MSETNYRRYVVLLLFCILACQLYVAVANVYLRPTAGSLRNASAWKKRLLMQNLPLVDIQDEVDVSVTNTPLEVEIPDQPIAVTVER